METERLFLQGRGQGEGGPGGGWAEEAAPPETYLREVWGIVGSSYRWARFVSDSGVELLVFGGLPSPGAGSSPWVEAVPFKEPILDPSSGEQLGVVELGVNGSALFPQGVLASAFGRTGYSVVFDQATGRFLYHPSRGYLGQPVSSLPWSTGISKEDPNGSAASSGSFTFRSGDTLRVGALSGVPGTTWAVLSTTALDEFSTPFLRIGLANVLLVVILTAVVVASFVVITVGATRSLVRLTRAADRVAAGDLSPPLPPADSDEVGRLARAFSVMTAELKEMLRRVEESRQMAAVGKFAS